MTNDYSGIMKRWLEALKTDRFTDDAFAYFTESLKTVLTPYPSAESLRSLAMFITFARHTPRTREVSPLRPSGGTRSQGGATPRRQTLGTGSQSPFILDPKPSVELDRRQIAVRVMEMYCSLLCNSNDTITIKKFARTVTNKVRTYPTKL